MQSVAIFSNSFCGNAGIDRVVRWQAEELTQKGNKVTIFTFKKDMELPKNVEVVIIKSPGDFFVERVWRLLFIFNIFKAIELLPKLKNFDTIYSHQYPLNWLAYLAKKVYGIEFVYYHHHLNPPESCFLNSHRLYTKLSNFLTLFSAKRADRAIAISKYSQETLIKSTGLKCEIIYDEIDSKRFHLGLDGSLIKAKFLIDNCPIILYVGRIAPSKRIDLLIESFYIVKEKIPGVKLLIVGKKLFDNYYEKLQGMCDDSVIFTGYVSDEELPLYYAACDVYATASFWEGFNLPAVEAQACGKPVVAFDIGPHSEIIKVPNNGLLVPAGDVAGLAEAIIKTLQSNLYV